MREKTPRQDDFTQAGAQYRAFEDWERDELINNLVGGIAVCSQDIQARMIEMLTKCDAEYGQRVKDGIAAMKMEASGANGAMNGSTNGHANGHANGNGSSNGHANGNSASNGVGAEAEMASK